MATYYREFEYMELDGETSVDDLLIFTEPSTLQDFIAEYKNFGSYRYLVKFEDGEIQKWSKKYFKTCNGESGRIEAEVLKIDSQTTLRDFLDFAKDESKDIVQKLGKTICARNGYLCRIKGECLEEGFWTAEKFEKCWTLKED